MVTQEEHDLAAENGRMSRLSVPCAISAHYDAATGIFTVDLNRGFSISFHKSRCQTLHNATDEQISEMEIYPPDSAIFFPKLDDGIPINALLVGRFGNQAWERAWADAHDVQISENTFDEPVYAVMVARTAASLDKDSSDIIF